VSELCSLQQEALMIKVSLSSDHGWNETLWNRSNRTFRVSKKERRDHLLTLFLEEVKKILDKSHHHPSSQLQLGNRTGPEEH
jgi:hypothetical protein